LKRCWPAARLALLLELALHIAVRLHRLPAAGRVLLPAVVGVLVDVAVVPGVDIAVVPGHGIALVRVGDDPRLPAVCCPVWVLPATPASAAPTRPVCAL
jgi:hypothetical protein